VIVDLSNEKPMIDSIQKRENYITRPLIANISQVLIVSSVKEPEIDYKLIDKLILNAYKERLLVNLIFTKSDLLDSDSNIKEEILSYYRSVAVDKIFLSTATGENINKVNVLLKDNVTILAGLSGTGKTSMINMLLDMNNKVGNLGEKSRRGKHTTRYTELFPLKEGGFLADTPGFNVTDIHKNISSSSLKDYYPDFVKYSKKFEYDVWYVDHISFLLDVKIIWMTLLNVIKREGVGEGEVQDELVDDLGFGEKLRKLKER